MENMKKNNIIFICLLLILSGCGKKEVSDNNLIVYQFKKNLINLITIEYEKIKKEDRKFYYITMNLSHEMDVASYVTLTDSGKRTGIYKVASKSNRVIKLKDGTIIPIVFDTDSDYTNITDKNELWKFGNRVIFQFDHVKGIIVKRRPVPKKYLY